MSTVQKKLSADQTLALMDKWSMSVSRTSCRKKWHASAWPNQGTPVQISGATLPGVVAALVELMESKGLTPYTRPGA